MANQRVVFTLYRDLPPLDLTRPFEVFATANRILGDLERDDPRHKLVLAGPGPTTES